MISKDYRCIFVHIPKTAGTSIEKDLRLFEEYTCDVQNHRTINEYRKELPPADFDTYFKFTFVRNPWARAVSWYKNLLEQSAHKEKFDIPEDCSLYDFLTVHKSNWGLQPQLHWIRYPIGTIPVDFIGRFENLQHDYGEVCKRLGIRHFTDPGDAQIQLEFRYHNPAAGEVRLVWGLNNFTHRPAKLPPNTFLTHNVSHMNTLMQRDGDEFVVQFEVDKSTRLDYAFVTTRTSEGKQVNLWKGPDPKGGGCFSADLSVLPADGAAHVTRTEIANARTQEWCELKTNVLRLATFLAKAADSRPYTDFYDDSTRAIVADRYAEEIEMFGYKFGE